MDPLSSTFQPLLISNHATSSTPLQLVRSPLPARSAGNGLKDREREWISSPASIEERRERCRAEDRATASKAWRCDPGSPIPTRHVSLLLRHWPGRLAVSVDDKLKVVACRDQQKRLSALEMDLATARHEGFVGKYSSESGESSGTKKGMLIVIGVLTEFGRKSKRDDIRKSWVSTGFSWRVPHQTARTRESNKWTFRQRYIDMTGVVNDELYISDIRSCYLFASGWNCDVFHSSSVNDEF